jgi:lysophospholipase L1-like esterase
VTGEAPLAKIGATSAQVLHTVKLAVNRSFLEKSRGFVIFVGLNDQGNFALTLLNVLQIIEYLHTLQRAPHIILIPPFVNMLHRSAKTPVARRGTDPLDAFIYDIYRARLLQYQTLHIETIGQGSGAAAQRLRAKRWVHADDPLHLTEQGYYQLSERINLLLDHIPQPQLIAHAPSRLTALRQRPKPKRVYVAEAAPPPRVIHKEARDRAAGYGRVRLRLRGASTR